MRDNIYFEGSREPCRAGTLQTRAGTVTTNKSIGVSDWKLVVSIEAKNFQEVPGNKDLKITNITGVRRKYLQ